MLRFRWEDIMNFKIAGAIALAVAGSSSAALAGGLERAIPSVSILFEDNTYLEFSGSFVLPELDGDDGVIPPGFPGAGATLSGNTGDLLDNYFNLGAAFKADITDELSYALIINQPLGANSSYPTGTSASPLDVRNVYGGSGAELVSVAATALLAYDVTDRVKVYAGPVVQFIDADASLSFLSDYNVDADPSFGYGFTVGAAYSVPDIALRVALGRDTVVVWRWGQGDRQGMSGGYSGTRGWERHGWCMNLGTGVRTCVVWGKRWELGVGLGGG
ncbi:MAG: hypothetical protein AAGA19_17395, partial [Pseudomonadota bacterium]